MTTEVICIVDTDATQAPDYTSLAAAIAGEAGGSPKCVTDADLVSNDEQLTIKCRATAGAVDSAQVDITGFTTDANCYVKVIVDTGHQHDGQWDNSKYRIVPTEVDPYYAVRLSDAYTEVHGIQARCDVSYDSAVCCFDFVYGIANTKFVDCLAMNERDDSTDHQIGFCIRHSSDQKVINCIAYGFKTSAGGGSTHLTSGIMGYGLGSGSAAYAYNCVTYDCKDGIAAYSGSNNKFHVRNCISVDCVESDYEDNGYGWGAASDKNIDSDGSAPGSTTLTRTSASLFRDAANYDFYPKYSGAAPEFGDDLSGVGSESHDIIGIARPQISNWDAGVFEYTVTSLPPTTLPPTTLAPTTLPPTTLPPTTLPPTTLPPTTLAPTTLKPTTVAPTTLPPTTSKPTTVAPTTLPPTTVAPTTPAPTTVKPTTVKPTTLAPTTLAPTEPPTTLEPTTLVPTTLEPTEPPTTLEPTTLGPTTPAPTTPRPTTLAPVTTLTTLAPTTAAPFEARRRGIRNFGFSMRDDWR